MLSAVESGSVVLIQDCRSLATFWVSFTSMVILSDLIRYCCGARDDVVFCEFAFEEAGIEPVLLIPFPLEGDEVVVPAPQPATSTVRITRPAMKKVVHVKFLTLCGIVPLLLKLMMVG